MPAKKFTGKYAPLAKPIVTPRTEYPRISLLEYEDKKTEYEQEVLKIAQRNAAFCMHESFKKIDLLFDYYDVDYKKDGWLPLVINLAQDYIPGFKVVKRGKSGAPQKWNKHTRVALYLEVSKLLNAKKKINPAFRPSDAIKIIAKEKGVHAKTLQNQYSLAKKSTFLKMLEKLGIETDELKDIWINYVKKEYPEYK